MFPTAFQQKRMADAFAAHVDANLADALWLTVTFQYEPSDFSAKHQFRNYCRALAQLERTHLLAAIGWDVHTTRDVIHYHAIMGRHDRAPLHTLTPDTAMERASHALDVDAARFSSAGGAAQYLSRHAHYDLQIACPRYAACRRRGCVIAPWRLSEMAPITA